jgi:hypothetical protein
LTATRRNFQKVSQPGGYPETGLAEINRDLLEADFAGLIDRK